MDLLEATERKKKGGGGAGGGVAGWRDNHTKISTEYFTDTAIGERRWHLGGG